MFIFIMTSAWLQRGLQEFRQWEGEFIVAPVSDVFRF